MTRVAVQLTSLKDARAHQPDHNIMAPYRIILMTPEGAAAEETIVDCANDDAAIDLTGEIEHDHEIHLMQGQRQVARFPPKARWGAS